MTDVLITAIHRIVDNVAQQFEISDRVDPLTGTRKLKAASRITKPGGLNEFPADIAADLIRKGAAREPTAAELRLRQMAQ
jgi:hypothetical protein